MTTEEKPVNEQESLQLIQSMISNAKGSINENGFHYMLWGYLVFVAAILHYVLLTIVDYPKPWLAWPVFMFSGGLIAMIYGYRQSKSQRVTTYIDSFMGYLWGGFVITLFIVLGFMYKLGPTNAYPIVILLYGMGTFVSGGILRFRPLIIGSILAWCMGIAAFLVSFEYQLLLIAGAILVSYIIPGHLLKANAKNV